MFVVFDLETTGWYEHECDVVQFAYTMFSDKGIFKKAETLYFYYKGMSWSEEAYEIHKIPQDFLKQHEDKFEENLVKMFTVLNLNKVCGHNSNNFDTTFATVWLSRMGTPKLSFTQMADTMLMYRSITKRPKIKLTKLGYLIGITEQQIQYFCDLWFGKVGDEVHAHNAAYDVTLTALLTLKAIDLGLVSFEPRAVNTFDDIDIDDIDDQSDVLTTSEVFDGKAIVFEDDMTAYAYYPETCRFAEDPSLLDNLSSVPYVVSRDYIKESANGHIQYASPKSDVVLELYDMPKDTRLRILASGTTIECDADFNVIATVQRYFM